MTECETKTISWGFLRECIGKEDGLNYYAIGDYLMPDEKFYFQVFVWILSLLASVGWIKVFFIDLWWQGNELRFSYAVFYWLICMFFTLMVFNLPYRLGTLLGLEHGEAVGVSFAIWSLGGAWILHKHAMSKKNA